MSKGAGFDEHALSRHFTRTSFALIKPFAMMPLEPTAPSRFQKAGTRREMPSVRIRQFSRSAEYYECAGPRLCLTSESFAGPSNAFLLLGIGIGNHFHPPF